MSTQLNQKLFLKTQEYQRLPDTQSGSQVAISGNTITIDNFLGEKATRTAAIADGVEVKVKGDIVTIEGNNVEHVGQTAANLEKATVVKGRDIRVFQDGVYTISKGVAQ